MSTRRQFLSDALKALGAVALGAYDASLLTPEIVAAQRRKNAVVGVDYGKDHAYAVIGEAQPDGTIRITDCFYDDDIPETLVHPCDREEYELQELVRQRFLASQEAKRLYNQSWMS